jgi:hypothetical protein
MKLESCFLLSSKLFKNLDSGYKSSSIDSAFSDGSLGAVDFLAKKFWTRMFQSRLSLL